MQQLFRLSQLSTPTEKAYLQSLVKGHALADSQRDMIDDIPFYLIGEYRKMMADTTVRPLPTPTRHKLFAAMDRAVHTTPQFAVGLAMSSARIENYETINGENLKGWYIGDGMTYLYDNDLRQYLSLIHIFFRVEHIHRIEILKIFICIILSQSVLQYRIVYYIVITNHYPQNTRIHEKTIAHRCLPGFSGGLHERRQRSPTKGESGHEGYTGTSEYPIYEFWKHAEFLHPGMGPIRTDPGGHHSLQCLYLAGSRISAHF